MPDFIKRFFDVNEDGTDLEAAIEGCLNILDYSKYVFSVNVANIELSLLSSIEFMNVLIWSFSVNCDGCSLV